MIEMHVWFIVLLAQCCIVRTQYNISLGTSATYVTLPSQSYRIDLPNNCSLMSPIFDYVNLTFVAPYDGYYMFSPCGACDVLDTNLVLMDSNFNCLAMASDAIPGPGSGCGCINSICLQGDLVVAVSP